MQSKHHYSLVVTWTGNRGAGTSGYRDYDRNHTISINGKPDILGSSDAAFRGDVSRHNPEDMLVASLSACHMLWYLHLCADAGIIVTTYEDHATGVMEESAGGGGRFTEVTLHPKVAILDGAMTEKANELHEEAHKKCFISNSVNFPILHKPECVINQP